MKGLELGEVRPIENIRRVSAIISIDVIGPSPSIAVSIF